VESDTVIHGAYRRISVYGAYRHMVQYTAAYSKRVYLSALSPHTRIPYIHIILRRSRYTAIYSALREIGVGQCKGNFFMYRACLGMFASSGTGFRAA
jgi:hypothetical protein